MGTKIKGDTNVAEDSAFREGKFSINGKNINVPLQALDLKKYYETKVSFTDNDIEICEIFKTYDSDKLKRMKQFPTEESKDRNELIRIKSSVKENIPCFLFLRYLGGEYPNEDQMKTLISISYSFSDATPLPILPDIFKEEQIREKSNGQVVKEIKPNITDEKFEDYVAFLDKYIELLNDLNHKDILGAIPTNMGTSRIRELLKFYYEKGIHHYFLDLNSGAFNQLIMGNLMYSILSELKRLGLEYQKTFIYCINGSPGRFTKGNVVVGSKDILSGGAGIDCIGRLHLGGGGGKSKITDPRVLEKLKLNRIRLFNKEDYGYYKLESKQLPFKLPKNSVVDVDSLLDLNKGSKYASVFNMQQLAEESKNLRENIREKYVPLTRISKEKKQVSDKDIKMINKYRTDKIKSLI